MEDKIGTKVQLQNIFISFPKKIVLKGLHLEDQSKDTLLYIDQLSIDTDLWALTHKSIQLNEIDLRGTNVFISRSDNAAFNFEYILSAFSDSTAVETNEGSVWRFSLEDIDLTNVSISYADDLLGNNLQAKVGSLKIEMKEFDLTHSVFNANSIEWSNSKVQFTQSKENTASSESTNESDTTPFSMNFGSIDLNKISITYTHSLLQQKLDATIGQFSIEANQIDWVHHSIDLDKIELHDSFVSYFQAGANKNEMPPDTTLASLKLPDWDIKLSELELSNNGFQYQDFNKPTTKNSFDPSHLWLKEIQVKAENMRLSKEGIQVSIKNLSASEQHRICY